MIQGDLVALKTKGFYAFLIRTGQRVFGRMSPDEAEYTHIVYVDEVLPTGDAWVIQAVRHIDRVLLSTCVPEQLVIPFPKDDSLRILMRPFASACIGMDYGVLSVISRALNYLTPRWFRIDFSRAGRMDCSAFTMRVWEHASVVIPLNTDPLQTTPGDVVKWFRVQEKVAA